MTSRWGALVFRGDADPAVLSRAVARGTLRRLATGVYTGVLDTPAEQVVADHLWQLVGRLLPGAVLVDRTARTLRPHDGIVTVDHARVRPLPLPGVTVVARRGPGPVEGDLPFLAAGVHLSSTARQLLDNLERGRGADRRTLTDAEVEEWIDALIRERGDDGINRLRDQARALAPTLGRERALERLEALIRAALSTGEARVPSSPVLQARAAGLPVDTARLASFEALAAELADHGPDLVVDLPQDAERRRLLPFYEAYFSNFIEGTEFTLDEAAGIVFDELVPEGRPEDAHDILGTYEIVADPAEMATRPLDPDQFEALLLTRHARVLAGRPDKHPGEYKHRANQVGDRIFVDPELVRGTLRRGFEIGAPLTSPFARSVFLMFLVCEVHPFADGNGRLARIMMNAELVAAGEVRIIIPIVYRANYVEALKGATQTQHYAGLIAALAFARRYTAQVDFTSRATAEADLQRTNALRDPYDAERPGVRLVLPSRAPLR